MRTIDADTAFGVLADYYHHSMPIQYMALKEALDRVPTVEAVPVIRCKGCIHRQPDEQKYMCMLTITEQCREVYMRDGDYCSHAERRTDEAD